MKIAIIDTQGPGGISEDYRALMPGVEISGVEPEAVEGMPCHRHGALCGWLAAIPSIATGNPVSLHFIRCFDPEAKWIEGCDEWLVDQVIACGAQYVSRSWGAWDHDDEFFRMVAQAAFAKFNARYLPLIKAGKVHDFGAAGNEDENDKDDDVAFPQAELLPWCNVIGAHDRAGVPCRWSGDGRGVLCTMWADKVWSPDAAGNWVLWSGTSAATPKACGAAAADGLTSSGWKDKAKTMADRPSGYTLPHPKWGWGSLEWAWQHRVSVIPKRLRPPSPAEAAARVSMFDYATTNRTNRTNKNGRGLVGIRGIRGSSLRGRR